MKSGHNFKRVISLKQSKKVFIQTYCSLFFLNHFVLWQELRMLFLGMSDLGQYLKVTLHAMEMMFYPTTHLL